mmetsp:Transcript_21165/g.32937  ORF Transcript_21165/g.32937 Transcript_21165/m.32937 type:complete len:104 (+) Transcript_21165:127-438(+)
MLEKEWRRGWRLGSVLIYSNLPLFWRGRTGVRKPMDSVRVDPDLALGHSLRVLLDDFRSNRDDVLSLPIFDEVKLLECADDIFHFDRGHFAHIFDTDVAFMLP